MLKPSVVESAKQSPRGSFTGEDEEQVVSVLSPGIQVLGGSGPAGGREASWLCKIQAVSEFTDNLNK